MGKIERKHHKSENIHVRMHNKFFREIIDSSEPMEIISKKLLISQT